MHRTNNKSPVLFYYWKIMGSFPLDFGTLKINKRSIGEVLYTLILMTTYTYAYTRVFVSRMSTSLPRETTMAIMMDFVGLGLEYSVLMVIWIYSIVYENRIQFIFEIFENTIDDAIALGMAKIHIHVFQRMQMYLLVFNVFCYVILILDSAIFYVELPHFDVITWMPFNILRPLSLNIISIYVFSLITIKKGFDFINKSISCLPEVSDDSNTLRGYGKQKLSAYEINNRLKHYGRLHAELCDLVSTLTQFFALPILIVLVIQFCQSIVNLYLMLMFMNTHHRNWSRQLSSIFMVMGWLTIRIVSIFFILDTCDSICAEANRTANVLHATWASRAPDGFREMLQILSYRFLRKRLEIKLYGAIQLNNKLEYKMAGMITTYLIIMLQLDEKTDDVN